MLVGSTGSAVMFVGGVAPATYGGKKYCIWVLYSRVYGLIYSIQVHTTMYIPTAIRYPLADDSLLETLHSYRPSSLPVTASVWW